MTYIIQQILNMLQLGSIYALIALGYTMVYGVLQMINFAHGDIFMIGAFLCYLSLTTIKASFALSLVISSSGAAVLGVVTERFAYRPLRHAPKVSAIITALGVGVFLENLTLALSPYPKHIPSVLSSKQWVIGGVTVSSLQVMTIALGVGLMLVLDFIVFKTKFGMALRAVSWDVTNVPLMGISVNKVVSVTFAIGAALAGAAGNIYAVTYPVIDPYMGVMVGWKAFISAVVGGIGNIRGAVLGGFILAGVEVMAAVALPSTYRDVVAFSLLLILLIYRPYGLLGRPKTIKV
ncbi:MAG: branched-chain amino acid ABC transporter permease [Nitrospirae bacterium]|nr:branched-chain amino acid ABC transporter permease [Nitrospirota bacterium]